MTVESCRQCKELLDQAATAISRHLRAVSRLDLAHERHENDLIPALELAGQQKSLERENSVEAYKSHTASHQAANSASA